MSIVVMIMIVVGLSGMFAWATWGLLTSRAGDQLDYWGISLITLTWIIGLVLLLARELARTGAQ